VCHIFKIGSLNISSAYEQIKVRETQKDNPKIVDRSCAGNILGNANVVVNSRYINVIEMNEH
jgi:hypothetical protein